MRRQLPLQHQLNQSQHLLLHPPQLQLQQQLLQNPQRQQRPPQKLLMLHPP